MAEPGRVRIVTDSTSDILPELRERYGIITVPLSVQFGTDVYLDTSDLTPEEFYAKQEAGPFPTTAQPPVGAFEEAYRRLQAEGASGVCAVIFSSKLSGTYNSAALAAKNLDGELPIVVIDTLSASMGAGYLALEAAKLAETGASLEAVSARVRELMPRIEVLFLVETLKWLERGGRINKARSLLGSVLSIKPLLRLHEGQLEPFQQPRTRSKAIAAMIEWIKSFPDPAGVAILSDGTDATRAEVEEIADRLTLSIPRDRITIAHYGTIYAVHLGPGGAGAIVLKRE
ncbi:MAG: DegV family protein [Thermomicrobia bacterium]|nr:DegV family protein [Thermomicrobia bacterium]